MCCNISRRHRSKSHGFGCNRASNRSKWSKRDASYRVYQLDGMTRNVHSPENSCSKLHCHRMYLNGLEHIRKQDSESQGFPEAEHAAWKKGDKSTLRVATTALESIPRRHDEEVAESGEIKSICDAVYNNTKPVNNTSLPPRYRRNMIKVLIKRACEE